MRLYKASLGVVPLGDWNRPSSMSQEGLSQPSNFATLRILLYTPIRRSDENLQGQFLGGSTWGLE
jgi:hypothetical protein